MKNLLPIYITCGLLFMTGCNKTDVLKSEDNGELKVFVNVVPIISKSTKSGSETVTADTVFVDEDVYVTAQQDVVMPNNNRTKGSIVYGGDINELTVNVRNTATKDFAVGIGKSDVTIDYKYGSGAFITETPYTLPTSSDKKTFLAYSPLVSASNGLSAVTPLKEELKYIVPSDVTNHPDLCIADISNNQNIVNTGANGQHLRTFNFYHALTAVGFAIRGSGAKIISANISGVSLSGNVSLSEKTVDDDTKKVMLTWKSIGAISTDIMSAGIIQEFFNVPWTSSWQNCTATDGFLMMVPQDLKDDAKLTVKYTYNIGADAGKEITFTTQLNKLIPKWESGTRVTYNIRLKTAPVVDETTNLDIPIFKAGFTSSKPLPFVGMAADDNITFTWEASWLRIHRGSPTYGSEPTGAPSGWNTGLGGPWNNIYFYSTNDNLSTMKRSAKVKIKGIKSQEATFIVTQMMTPTLTVTPTSLNVRNFNSRPWENGTLNTVTYTSNYPVSAIGFKNVPSWLHPRVSGNKIIIDYDWNIQAQRRRVGTFAVCIKIGTSTYLERNVSVTQDASNFWISTNGNSFNYAIYHSNIGYNFARENRRCYSDYGYRGDRVPSVGEFESIMGMLRANKWENNANFPSNEMQYWTNDGDGSYWGVPKNRYLVSWGWGSSTGYYISSATYNGNRQYRCITRNRWSVY